jgi:hypothetical protein
VRRPTLPLLATAAAVAGAAALVATRGSIAPPAPNPPGTFSFAALGDAPYYAIHGEERRYALVLRELDAHDLSFILHVGDIFERPCADDRYRRTLDEFNARRHPVVYTPGDNEWADCWQEETGGFQPLERLTRLRQIFYASPAQSLGGRRIPVISQEGDEPYAEFVENVRWMHQGIVFATVHLPGSGNAREPFDGRTRQDDEASVRRTNAAVAWLRAIFGEARERGASAVVIGFHANVTFEAPIDDKYRQSYEPFITTLEEEVERFANPVLVVHGDFHEYLVDRPLVRRTTGRRLDNLTRVQVPGSPDIGWVRVVVTPAPRTTFAFESHVVPFWKLW